MALFDIENVGNWAEGGFTGALVTAPNAEAALREIQHYVDQVGRENLKVTKISTGATRRIFVGFND